jgi:hypothetical protein
LGTGLLSEADSAKAHIRSDIEQDFAGSDPENRPQFRALVNAQATKVVDRLPMLSMEPPPLRDRPSRRYVRHGMGEAVAGHGIDRDQERIGHQLLGKAVAKHPVQPPFGHAWKSSMENGSILELEEGHG